MTRIVNRTDPTTTLPVDGSSIDGAAVISSTVGGFVIECNSGPGTGGEVVGLEVGEGVGCPEGRRLGIGVGLPEGFSVGVAVGSREGTGDGLVVGAFVTGAAVV